MAHTFGHTVLDRSAGSPKDAAWYERAVDDPSARFLPIHAREPLLATATLCLLDLAELQQAGVTVCTRDDSDVGVLPVLLGRVEAPDAPETEDSGFLFAVHVPKEAACRLAVGGRTWEAIRSLLPRMRSEDAALVGQAVAMLEHHSKNRH